MRLVESSAQEQWREKTSDFRQCNHYKITVSVQDFRDMVL